MTAKTFDQLIVQANATLADNVTRLVSAQDVRDMHIDHLDSHAVGTLLVVAEQGTPLPSAGSTGRLFFETAVSSLYVGDGTIFKPVLMTFAGRGGPAIVPAANDYSLNLLSDVVIAAPALDHELTFDGALWRNQGRQWTESGAGDWIPKNSGQGIGSADASPNFVAVGDVGTNALEGVIAERKDSDGGGIAIIGFRGDPLGGTEPNAPVGIAGSSILLDGTLFLTVPAPVTDDHFLITKPSITLPDGREVVPIVLGPTFTPTTSETQTDNRSVAITPAATEIVIIGSGSQNGALVLANAYSAGSILNLSLIIEETAGNSAIITITVKINLVDAFQDTINLQGNRFNYFASQPTVGSLSVSDSLTVHVDYVNGAGGGTRTVLVRGDVTISTIEIEST